MPYLYLYKYTFLCIFLYVDNCCTYSIIYKVHFYIYHFICVNTYLYKSMPTCIRECCTQCSMPSLAIGTPRSIVMLYKKVQSSPKESGIFTHTTRNVLQMCLNLGHQIFKSTRQQHYVPEQNDCHSLVPLNSIDLPTPCSSRRQRTHKNRQTVTVSLQQVTFCLKNFFSK